MENENIGEKTSSTRRSTSRRRITSYQQNRAQVYDPVTDRWIKIDTKHGGIVQNKKSPGRFKNVRVAQKKRNVKKEIAVIERIKISELSNAELKKIQSKFKKGDKNGEYQRFYKSSGTAMLTKTKPPDLKNLLIDKISYWPKKMKVTELTVEQDRIISDLFKKGTHLPFYKSSGTSVFTCRKPPDYDDFHFKLPEFKYYVPEIFFRKNVGKK